MLTKMLQRKGIFEFVTPINFRLYSRQFMLVIACDSTLFEMAEALFSKLNVELLASKQ